MALQVVLTSELMRKGMELCLEYGYCVRKNNIERGPLGLYTNLLMSCLIYFMTDRKRVLFRSMRLPQY